MQDRLSGAGKCAAPTPACLPVPRHPSSHHGPGLTIFIFTRSAPRPLCKAAPSPKDVEVGGRSGGHTHQGTGVQTRAAWATDNQGMDVGRSNTEIPAEPPVFRKPVPDLVQTPRTPAGAAARHTPEPTALCAPKLPAAALAQPPGQTAGSARQVAMVTDPPQHG